MLDNSSDMMDLINSNSRGWLVHKSDMDLPLMRIEEIKLQLISGEYDFSSPYINEVAHLTKYIFF